MIAQRVENALNEQINAEIYSAYLYLAMAAHFESENLSGFAQWMRVQTQEEEAHARKLFDYVLERGGKVALKAIDAPPSEWKSPLAAFEAAHEHEQFITDRINKLAELAVEQNDHAAGVFLQWYISEQVEEEASVDRIVRTLKATNEAPGALYMIDRELGRRGSKG
jgi:ferritin